MKVPVEWLPPAQMQRIIMHWTAGQHDPSDLDREHYHVLVTGNGGVVRGKPSIAANEAPTRPGYAAHTLNCNSGSIGVSLCAMAMAVENPFDAGKQPITVPQFETFVQVVAELAVRYRIGPTRKTILSHAEVQETLGIKQRGKWDIARLPFDDTIKGSIAVGDYIRRRVNVAMRGLEVEEAPAKLNPAGEPIKTGVITADPWLILRPLPSTSVDRIGMLPKGSRVEIHGTQGAWSNVQAPSGARGWASSRYIAT